MIRPTFLIGASAGLSACAASVNATPSPHASFLAATLLKTPVAMAAAAEAGTVRPAPHRSLSVIRPRLHRSSNAPLARVADANRGAVREPSPDDYLGAVQTYPWSEGALYRLYAAPGTVSDIVLQPGETLVSVAAGDTLRWVIGDTTSGGGPTRRTHILVKPSGIGLSTNLLIATDRRTYHVDAMSNARTAMASLSWTYPEDALVALRGTAAIAADPVPPGVAIDQLNFDYRIEGANVVWRPIRAFDDGRQVFIQFPPSLAQGEAPPLFVTGDRSRAELVNYRIRGLYYVVDRLFGRGRTQDGREAPASRADRPRCCQRPPGPEGIMSDPVRAVEPPSPPKESPDGLALRGRPRPAVRFRRGLIVGVMGAVAATLVTLSWLALEPPSFHQALAPIETDQPAKAGPDALANAPGSYGDVPRLGPPLPGDLGRAILEQQQRSLEAAQPPVGSATSPGAAPTAADARREQLVAARTAARSSAVLFQLEAPRNLIPSGQPPPDTAPAIAEPRVEAAATSAGQLRKIEFARSADTDQNAHEVRAATSPWTLSAGTVISASLITGLNSDLPGTVLAQVSANVRDSATGRTILIPQGARLIGSYDSMVAYGQRRALLVWTRLVFPDGSSVQLDHMPATDAGGYAGLEDAVDSHTWQLLKGIGLSTLLGVSTQLSFGGEGGLVRAIRESTQQNAAKGGDRITAHNLDVQPTIKVRPGWPVRVLVSKDLALRPWRG